MKTPLALLLWVSLPAHAAGTFKPGPEVVVVDQVLTLRLQVPAAGVPSHCVDLGTYRGALAEVSSFTSSMGGGDATGVDLMVGQVKSVGVGQYSRRISLCASHEVVAELTSVTGYVSVESPPVMTRYAATIEH